MLKPSADRLDYTELLSPPSGFQTEYAIGATYSLDLDALIGASLALGLSESVDGELFDSPVCLLNALMRTSDRVALFCQGGQIKAPTKPSALHTLLDRMVFEVNLRNRKSFHPKVWFVKYSSDAEDLWRVIVLSRNLTFDRSWDVALYLEGSPDEAEQDANGPLRDFLLFLQGNLSSRDQNAAAKRSLLRSALRDVMSVRFSPPDGNYTGFSFCPTGIPRNGGGSHNMEQSGLFAKYDELLVMSPFLSASTQQGNPMEQLTRASRPSGDCTLITRRSELSKLSSSVLERFRVHVMREEVLDGESFLSESAQASTAQEQQDIHAKLYLRTRGSDSELFVGSQNASFSAFSGGNVEFMLKLTAKRRHLNVEVLKHDLYGSSDKENPFEEIDPTAIPPYEAECGPDLENAIKEICRSESKAQVKQEDDGYSIDVEFSKLPKELTAELCPLLWERPLELEQKMTFCGLPLSHLCEFYKLTVRNGEEWLSRIIRIRTDGIPQERDSSIVNSVLRDRQGFLSYVSLILGENYYLSLLEMKKFTGTGYLFAAGEQIPALYEKMLRTAATSPEKLQDIGKLLGMITDKGIVPKGFEELYKTFRKAVQGI